MRSDEKILKVYQRYKDRGPLTVLPQEELWEAIKWYAELPDPMEPIRRVYEWQSREGETSLHQPTRNDFWNAIKEAIEGKERRLKISRTFSTGS